MRLDPCIVAGIQAGRFREGDYGVRFQIGGILLWRYGSTGGLDRQNGIGNKAAANRGRRSLLQATQDCHSAVPVFELRVL